MDKPLRRDFSFSPTLMGGKILKNIQNQENYYPLGLGKYNFRLKMAYPTLRLNKQIMI